MSVTCELDMGVDACQLARDLLGRHLVRVVGGRRMVGRIVETEAYGGHEDLASHARGGRRTPRNESMFLAGGHAYVYLVYGMHHCVNVVCGAEGTGMAVLLRALEPIEGLELMRAARPKAGRDRDLCRGPGRLCQAMGIDRSLDGLRLSRSNDLWIEDGDPVVPGQQVASVRIGLGDVGSWAAKPWRFTVAGNRFVSGPSPLAAS